MSNFNPITSCNCPQPCAEGDYTVTVSNALWPSQSFTPQQCEAFTSWPPSWSDASECHDWYANNTLLIEVYYERMNYQDLSESAAYGPVNLISDIGGQLGLWMGLSAITVVEFLSLCVLLLIYCFAKCCRKPPVGPTGASPATQAYGDAKGAGGFNPENSLPPRPVMAN